jgi:hypothetical protein
MGLDTKLWVFAVAQTGLLDKWYHRRSNLKAGRCKVTREELRTEGWPKRSSQSDS